MSHRYQRELISLGENCEPDFKIHKYDRNAKSYAYSWAAVHDRELFIRSLHDLEGLLKGEVSKEKAAILGFSEYKSAFHIRPEFAKEGPEIPEDGLNELISRENHLIEKTKRVFSDPESEVCFLQAVKGSNYAEDARYISSLSDSLFSLC